MVSLRRRAVREKLCYAGVKPKLSEIPLLQVDSLSAQIAELSEEAKEVPMLREAIESANRERTEAEQKVHVAVNENQQIQEQVGPSQRRRGSHVVEADHRMNALVHSAGVPQFKHAQVSKLKLEVTRIRADTGRKAKQGLEGKGVLEQVTNLQSALDDAKGGQEQLKMKAKNAEMQKDAASKRETQLRSEIAGMRGKLEAADEQLEDLRHQAGPHVLLMPSRW